MSLNTHPRDSQDNVVNDGVNPTVDLFKQVVDDLEAMKQVIEYLQRIFRMVGLKHALAGYQADGNPIDMAGNNASWGPKMMSYFIFYLLENNYQNFDETKHVLSGKTTSYFSYCKIFNDNMLCEIFFGRSEKKWIHE